MWSKAGRIERWKKTEVRQEIADVVLTSNNCAYDHTIPSTRIGTGSCGCSSQTKNDVVINWSLFCLVKYYWYQFPPKTMFTSLYDLVYIKLENLILQHMCYFTMLRERRLYTFRAGGIYTGYYWAIQNTAWHCLSNREAWLQLEPTQRR